MTQLFEICHEIALSSTGGFASILLAVLLLAFVGSFSHCTFMCSPFVLMQISQNHTTETPVSEWQRLKGAALLPYHVGRVTTYGFLGGFSAFIGTQISQVSSSFIATLLSISGMMMIAYAFAPQRISQLLKFKFLGHLYDTNITKKVTKSLFINPTLLKRYALGLTLGFIPCGMVYIALTATATLGSFLKGFIVMIVFGIATIPALFTVGMFSQYFTDNLGRKTKWLTSISLIFAGAWLCFIAISLLKNK